jgi:hypothetical protein
MNREEQEKEEKHGGSCTDPNADPSLKRANHGTPLTSSAIPSPNHWKQRAPQVIFYGVMHDRNIPVAANRWQIRFMASDDVSASCWYLRIATLSTSGLACRRCTCRMKTSDVSLKQILKG